MQSSSTPQTEDKEHQIDVSDKAELCHFSLHISKDLRMFKIKIHGTT